jgi:hypothetical protein
MTDLFISYSSHDRPWAEQLFNDLKKRFPTVSVFWDRESIPAGEQYRKYFEKGARNTGHLVALWSNAAKDSDEVSPEIQAFLQNVETNPTTKAGTKRRAFPVPLELGTNYGPLKDYQGFPDFQTIYDKNAADRGISKLDGVLRTAWDRMIGIIANAALEGRPTQPITLALMVMTTATTAFDERFFNLKISKGPTLSQFLQSVGLTAEKAKERYGDTAFSWRPFGAGKTIVELMDDVRERAIRNLGEKLGETYRFHWEPIDFVEAWMTAPDEAASRRLIQSLSDKPSVIVTDPISLFAPIVRESFNNLGEYAKQQQSMILSISPSEQLAIEPMYQTLYQNGQHVLGSYLYPLIPATETFAHCGMNVQHPLEIERLIRSGLGYYHLQKIKAASQPFVSGV